VRSSHVWSVNAARFDELNLVSCAGLVPVLALAEQTGLESLLARVRFKTSKVRSGGVNPGGKLGCVIAGMVAGADCIDDLDVIRSGGMPQLFGGVYACATLGILLREFTFGHTKQLASAARAHLVALANRTQILDGADRRVFVDIDSLLRPVYGHAKQGASYGHTKIAGRQVLRKGLSPLATTLSTPSAAPVVAGIRLRAGRTGSGKGAASMVTEAITTARAAVPGCEILLRGDSAFGNSHVVAAARAGGARFSVVITKTRTVNRAIAAIDQHAWTPVHYPGAVLDPDTGELISDAEVAEIEYTAFTSTKHPVTVDRAPGPRPQPPRHPVPGLALSPVLHRQPATDHRRGHRPPPPRNHRDRVLRPHRRTARTPALGELRRELSLGDLRRDGPQPAPRRRHPDPQPARPERDPATTIDQRARQAHPSTTPTHPAPAHPLALGPAMARVVAQHLPHQTPTAHRRVILPNRPPTPRPTRRSWPDQQDTHALNQPADSASHPKQPEDHLRGSSTDRG
jgi:hypothetical protein